MATAKAGKSKIGKPPRKAVSKTPAAKKATPKKAAKVAAKRTTAVPKPVAKTGAAKKATASQPLAKKTVVNKSSARESTAKKAVAEKAAVRKVPVQKTPVSKAAKKTSSNVTTRKALSKSGKTTSVVTPSQTSGKRVSSSAKATAGQSLPVQATPQNRAKDAGRQPAAKPAVQSARISKPGITAGKPRKITPEQALANTRALLEAKKEHDRQTQPWQMLDHHAGPIDHAGYQSPEAADKAGQLHEGESRMQAIQGSISSTDRTNQGKRDAR